MAYEAANHYEAAGAGIRLVVDTTGFGGKPVVSLDVDGRPVEGAMLSQTSQGLTVEGVVDEVPDRDTTLVRVLLPRVNVAGEPLTFSGFVTLTTSRTSIGGPGLVLGAVQLYDLRPIAGTASVVDF